MRSFDIRASTLGLLSDARTKIEADDNPEYVLEWLQVRCRQIERQIALVKKFNSAEGRVPNEQTRTYAPRKELFKKNGTITKNAN